MIHGLRTFKYRNICDLFDNVQDKDKRGRIMVKKCFVLHKEVIDIFHDKLYIPTIEKLPFHLSRVSILGSMECWKTRNCFLMMMHPKKKPKKYYAEEFS